MPQSQNPFAGLAFLLFLIWLIFPEGDYQSQSLALSDLAAERLVRFHDALDVLNTSHWHDFSPLQNKNDKVKPSYLNLTGFREDDGLAWEDLGRFRERTLEFSRYAVPAIGDGSSWDAGEGEALWTNASGTVHGEWVKRQGSVARSYESYNLSKTAPNMDWVNDKASWARNITGHSGRMLLRIEGNKTVDQYEGLPAATTTPVAGGLIRSVKGTTTVEDSSGSGQSWEMRLWGVHWPRQGVILMTTTSEKFEGIFGLPHLAPSEEFFQSSQRLLNQSIARTIARKEENMFVDQTVPWTSDLENPMYTTNPSPHCEYIMYAQVHPPSRAQLNLNSVDQTKDDMRSVLDAIESELHSPQGAPIPRIPELQMSAVIYSPDCGFFLESKGPPDFGRGEARHLRGMKSEVHIYQAKSWILIYAAVVFVQVNLLKNQMRESCTPSTMGRVSFWTITMMLMIDGMTFVTAATWMLSVGATFLPALALIFAAFLSMTIGGSFLAKIHEVQLPEARPRRGREQTANTSVAASTTTTTSVPSPPTTTLNPPSADNMLPAPVTASQQARPLPQPVIIPSDQDIDAEIAATELTAPGTTAAEPSTSPPSFQSIVGRMMLFSLCFIFLSVSSMTWYPHIRSVFLNVCVLLYLSFWVPQIYRNIRRNCRRALAWPFVLGQSVLRLLPIAYFWVKEDNFLYARPERHAFLIFCAWIWIQLFILAAQDIVGPRFGIPSGWTPDAWDYHPILREDSLEAGGLPIGLVADMDKVRSDDDHTKKPSPMRAIDCAICREVLEVPVLTAEDEDTSVAGVFARRLYMVTPCRHIFHSACLEGWMRFRLQCPNCREELPPL